jgi:hypothetical protein
MKKTLIWIFTAFLILASSAMATSPMIGTITNNEGGESRDPIISTLDEECWIDFEGYTYGSNSGSMTWPGGSGEYRLTGLSFDNSCSEDENLIAYCIDLSHELQQGPYCVNIDSFMVRALYPEQIPAIAYIMTWYPAASALEDRIQQLSIWKLSNDMRHNQPTYLKPYYHMNANRGYPALSDPPVYPYVNTVVNSDAAINGPANLHILDALGYGSDDLAKNVALCDDDLLIATGEPVIEGDVSTIPVTVTLQRGDRAQAVNNLSLSGVKLLISVDNGIISKSVAFTDDLGSVSFTVSQEVPAILESNLHIYTYSVWPRSIVPCNQNANYQQLVVQQLTEGELCSLYVDLTIEGDQYLAVELAGFDAVAGDRSVNLNWTTASETGNDHFDILREGAIVGRVTARNSATGSTYSWSESNLTNGREYTYALAAVDISGTSETIGTVNATPTASAATITEYALHQNYPNPFNPETSITFDILEAGNVSLTVYNATGQTIATLVNGSMTSGRHSITFDAANLPSGLYFYRLDAGNFSAVKKMILMK